MSVRLAHTFASQAVSPEEAIETIRSGMRVFVHGAAATPTPLLEALADGPTSPGSRSITCTRRGPAPFAAPEHRGALPLGVALRRRDRSATAIDEGRADFIPVFLSDIPGAVLVRALPLDVALLQLSPPDRHGYCTLGTSVDTALAASRAARYRDRRDQRADAAHARQHARARSIASHAFIHTNRPLHAVEPAPPSPVEDAIGEQVAALVPDGATLQMGIGAIPDAALRRLTGKHDLGIHTEMFSDGVSTWSRPARSPTS